MILQVVLVIQKIIGFSQPWGSIFCEDENPQLDVEGFHVGRLASSCHVKWITWEKTKKIPELGGFQHDSSNNRLQLFFWTKKDRRYENTKPIQFICLLPRLFKNLENWPFSGRIIGWLRRSYVSHLFLSWNQFCWPQTTTFNLWRTFPHGKNVGFGGWEILLFIHVCLDGGDEFDTISWAPKSYHHGAAARLEGTVFLFFFLCAFFLAWQRGSFVVLCRSPVYEQQKQNSDMSMTYWLVYVYIYISYISYLHIYIYITGLYSDPYNLIFFITTHQPVKLTSPPTYT